ncbi:MAG: hypothetical protein ABSB97_00755 [Thermoplasmata archaeon]|jgi:hypothetical protein
MKQIHVWPNHIRIPHIDLVLARAREEPLTHTLNALARLGFDTRPGNVEVHGGVPAG